MNKVHEDPQDVFIWECVFDTRLTLFDRILWATILCCPTILTLTMAIFSRYTIETLGLTVIATFFMMKTLEVINLG